MKLQQSLEQVVARWRELSALLNDHPEPGSPAFTEMLREHHDLQPLVERVEALQAKQRELEKKADKLGKKAKKSVDATQKKLAAQRG